LAPPHAHAGRQQSPTGAGRAAHHHRRKNKETSVDQVLASPTHSLLAQLRGVLAMQGEARATVLRLRRLGADVAELQVAALECDRWEARAGELLSRIRSGAS
jgi:nucleotidyltransferase/DNA polymerase involved in DNA repair